MSSVSDPRRSAASASSAFLLRDTSAESWYGGGQKRYDYYYYNDGELSEWVDAMNSAQERTEEVLFLFNNCYRGQAIANAQGLRALIEERTGFPVAPPLAEPPPQQRSLF